MGLWTPTNLTIAPKYVFDPTTFTYTGSNFTSGTNTGSVGGAWTIGAGTPAKGTQLNGFDVIGFTGSQSFLNANAAWAAGDNVFIFTVAKVGTTHVGGLVAHSWANSTATSSWTYYPRGGAGFGGSANEGWLFQGFSTSAVTRGDIFTDTNFHIAVMKLGASGDMRKDGLVGSPTQINAAINLTTNLNLRVGATVPASEFLTGDVAYIAILTDPVLSEIQKLEGWAAWKYGLVSQLDAGHPYKSAAPLDTVVSTPVITDNSYATFFPSSAVIYHTAFGIGTTHIVPLGTLSLSTNQADYGSNKTIAFDAVTMLNLKTGGFGALGNGIADDTVAINNALVAAKAAGKTVFVPNGIYMHNAKITVDASGLIGQGNNAIFRATAAEVGPITLVADNVYTGSSDRQINIVGAGPSIVKNLRIDATTTIHRFSTPSSDAIHIQGSNVTIDSVTVDGGTGVQGFFSAGIHTESYDGPGNLSNITYTNNLVINTNADRYRIAAWNGFTISGIRETRNLAVSLAGGAAGDDDFSYIGNDITVISDVIATLNVAIGPKQWGQGADLEGVNGVTFKNNKMVFNGSGHAPGIIVQVPTTYPGPGSTNITISNNVFDGVGRNDSRGPLAAIAIDQGPCNNIQILNNSITNTFAGARDIGLTGTGVKSNIFLQGNFNPTGAALVILNTLATGVVTFGTSSAVFTLTASASIDIPTLVVSVSGTAKSDQSLNVIVKFEVHDSGNAIIAWNQVALSLIANISTAVNMTIVLPVGTPIGTYRVDGYIYSSDFSILYYYAYNDATFQITASAPSPPSAILADVVTQTGAVDTGLRGLGIPVGYDWAAAGRAAAGPITPPLGWNALGIWAQFYPQAGQPIIPCNLFTTNWICWAHLKTGGWFLIQTTANTLIDGAHFVADFSNNASIPFNPPIARQSDGSDKLPSPPSGYNDHFWLVNRGGFTAETVDGTFQMMQARIDNASSNIIGNIGVDFWQSLGAIFPNNYGDGPSDWVKMTTSYQTLYWTNFTSVQLLADPPPPLIVPPSQIVVPPRNIYQQPFGPNSIWNMPIGKGTGAFISGGTGAHGRASFKYTNNDGPIYEFANAGVVTNTLYDENLILMGPSSPAKQVFTNTINWSVNPSAPARCSAAQTATGTFVPVPANASYPGLNGGDVCTTAGVNGSLPNCSAAILLADRVSFYQQQPMQICSVGGSPTTQFFFNPNVNIFADETSTQPSAWGSHGGSAMSAVGGTIRVDDLIPGNCPIVPGVADVMRHAIGVGFIGHLFDAFTTSHVWPARNNDFGNEGLLLALLPTFNINSLLSPAGQSLAWTAMNYGFYIADCSGWDAINIETEYSYGDTSVNCPTGRSACQIQTYWNNNLYIDIRTICQNLYVITNNTLSTIGGPGTLRLQPKAVAAIDPGVMTTAPVITNKSWNISHLGLSAGMLVGQSIATKSPFKWTLAGTGAANFWIQPSTGLIYVSTAGVGGIVAGTYSLTVTAKNIIGTGSGIVTFVVS